MSETALTLLKFFFLALVYLFLFRVVRVVVLEMREPTAGSPNAGDSAPPRDRKSLTLRLVDPPARRGEIIPIQGEITVGRAGGCALVIPDDTFVSQVHARLWRRDGETLVEDLGSKNGTYVNGERVVAPTRLRKGDRVQFGQTVAEVAR